MALVDCLGLDPGLPLRWLIAAHPRPLVRLCLPSSVRTSLCYLSTHCVSRPPHFASPLANRGMSATSATGRDKFIPCCLIPKTRCEERDDLEVPEKEPRLRFLKISRRRSILARRIPAGCVDRSLVLPGVCHS